MKYRNGWVSNSSSSSFLIRKKDISKKLIKKIKAHKIKGPKLGIWLYSDWDEWEITEDKHTISGSTIMNNFDMYSFMEKIGVDMSKVQWDDNPFRR